MILTPTKPNPENLIRLIAGILSNNLPNAQVHSANGYDFIDKIYPFGTAGKWAVWDATHTTITVPGSVLFAMTPYEILLPNGVLVQQYAGWDPAQIPP
jgi:hypothetical protein